MEESILTKRSAILIGILFGLPIGCLVTLGIVGIVQQPIEGLRTMKFGNVAVSIVKRNNANDKFAEELMFMKDNRAFLFITRNKPDDEVCRLILSDVGGKVRLTLSASSVPGKWFSAMYGPPDLGGEFYQDFYFDGQFDIRKKIDNNGKVQSNHIYYEENWKKIDVFRDQKAISGNDTFTFQKGSGWQLEKVAKDEENEDLKNMPKNEE